MRWGLYFLPAYFCVMFKGIKVMELAGVLAGPAVGMFFAELGATVIKVENPLTGGDVTRQWKLPAESPDAAASAYFASVNWGKTHRFIQLGTAEGRSEILALLQDTDIVICNWKKGDDLKFGLDYATIKNLRPDIIYANLTGFGREDSRVAYDVVLQAEAGWMFMNGTPDSGPVKIPVAIIDLFAAHQLKEGVLTACIRKLKTGEGALVTVSLFDAAVSALANQASNYLMAQHIPQRIGSLHPNIAPYGEIVTTSDGKQFVLAVGTDHQFGALCHLLDLPELINDPRFRINGERVKNRKLLFEKLEPALRKINSNYFADQCRENKIPVGKINNMQEVFENASAQNLLLNDAIGSRVKTVVFSIE